MADAIVVVESRQVVLAPPPAGSNDRRVPIDEGLIGPEHVHAEIGELLAGVRPGRTSADQITLYKSVGIAAQDVAAAHLGIAAQDVAAAHLVLTAARAAGLGVEVVL